MSTLILKTLIKLCSKFTHLKWVVKRSCYNGFHTHLRVHWGMPRCRGLFRGGSPDPRPTEGGVRRGRSGDLWRGQVRYWKKWLHPLHESVWSFTRQDRNIVLSSGSSCRYHQSDYIPFFIIMKCFSVDQSDTKAGPLFTKRQDVLPPNLVKFRSREIGCCNGRIALKFDRHLGSNFRAIGKV